MNRTLPPAEQPSLFVEALEPRIAPAGLLNESKFTSVVVGGALLLDATDPNGFQGLSTGFGANSGAYLLYITAGKALVFTSDINGNGQLDRNEITGIAAGVDAQGHALDLIAFTSINGDIVTNLLPGTGVSVLTDSDNNPNNGRDGRILLDNSIHSVTLRTITASDLDITIAGNTVSNRLAPTSFSIYGNIYTGGDFGAAGAGLTIDTTGAAAVGVKYGFNGGTPQIGDIMTGTAANNQHFRFTISAGADIQTTLLPFKPKSGEHGADIIGVHATTAFDLGTLATGDGGLNARGGNLSEIVLRGDRGGYKLIAGNGGQGATGATGGSIIDFADLSSTTSEVILHTGDGGVGLLGAGGQAGTATLSTANIAANLRIFLGNGGDGFTAGGNGATQQTGSFTPPEGPIPVGGVVQGTYHNPGDIGNTHVVGANAAGQLLYQPTVINFNSSGALLPNESNPTGSDGLPIYDDFGDAIFTSINPDQIVVVFGDGNGGFDNSRTVYLNAPGLSANSVTVADVNGDGLPDIIAASATGDSASGIYVFLNQTHDPVHNPLGGRIFTGNPLGDHPFSSAFQSPLPLFGNGPLPVFNLAAGDFNGDGLVDVGLVSTLGTQPPGRSLLVLFGDEVRNPDTGARVFDPVTGKAAGSGYFVANTDTIPRGFPILQIAGAGGNPLLKATSLVANSGAPDVLVFGAQGGRSITEFSVNVDPVTHAPLSFGLNSRGFGLGLVDTNRGPQVTSQAFTLRDYTVQDLNGDGAVDIVALSIQPELFLVTLRGTPGSLVPNLVNSNFGLPIASSPNGANDAGIFLGDIGLGGTLTGIVPVDQAGRGLRSLDGIFNQVAIFRVPDSGPAVIYEISLENRATGAPDFYAGGTGVLFSALGLGNSSDDSAVLGGLGAFYSSVSNPLTGYGAAEPNTANPNDARIDFFGVTSTGFLSAAPSRYITDNGVRITAGDGGNAIAGVAGTGGSVGSGLLSSGTDGDAAGNVQLRIPAYLAYRGQFILTAGDGGDGFGGGGLGGDIVSVSARYADASIAGTTKVQLFAGDGGDGISGDGGRGGDLSQFSVQSGDFFIAGDGGTGLRGGRGGSVFGNQLGFFDTQPPLLNPIVTVQAGQGAVGALSGGTGGAISNFVGQYNLLGSSLNYASGNGGSAPAGTGGTGGAISDSSPDNSVNLLAGNLALRTGIGGNGLLGGNGGAITNFVNQPSSFLAIPISMSVVTGVGGTGLTSAGGAGGAISNFRANALGFDANATGLNTGIVRIIAGDGGASFGNVGGAGGSVMGSVAQAQSTPLALVAGAGGDGVAAGGAGGSVMNVTINSAAQTLGKVLVIAGAGGNATALTRTDVGIPDDSNTNDLAHALLAFGGASGIGGDGGNISNLTQPASVQTAVDLIAGNGGSTINYGNTLSPTSGVGRGGSVTNINLAGTVGASSRDPNSGVNPPIRAYNDLNNDGTTDATIAQFVRDNLGGVIGGFGQLIPNNPAFILDNVAGNVGIVAGAAGRVLGGQPARDGVNGSVQNVSASSIMSIVAGSVDRVSPVQTLSGISARNIDGVLGADKSLPTSQFGGAPNNVVEYFIENGQGVSSLQPGQPAVSQRVAPSYANGAVTISNLQPGFRLIDGAIYAQNIIQPALPPFIQGPRVFVFAQS
jgi:hypothetical protein